MRSIRKAFVALLVPAATAVLTFTPSGYAFVDDVPASEVRAPGSRDKDLAFLRSLLTTPAAERRLADAGVTREAAMRRIERMTPAEIHYLAQRADADVKAGGDALEVLAIIAIIALIVVLIFVLVDKKLEVRDRSAHAPANVKTKPENGALARGAVLE